MANRRSILRKVVHYNRYNVSSDDDDYESRLEENPSVQDENRNSEGDAAGNAEHESNSDEHEVNSRQYEPPSFEEPVAANSEGNDASNHILNISPTVDTSNANIRDALRGIVVISNFRFGRSETACADKVIDLTNESSDDDDLADLHDSPKETANEREQSQNNEARLDDKPACRICWTPLSDIPSMVTPCGHCFCQTCILLLGFEFNCPICRKQCSVTSLYQIYI